MIRRAHSGDVEDVAALRLAMWNELHPDDRGNEHYLEELRAYFARVLADESVCVWIAEDSGEIVGGVTLLIQEWPPRKRGRELRGYVTAVYVAERARRRGHARALMDAVLQYARENQLRRVVLRTTEAARPLYTELGFAHLEHLAIELA
jgi:ribosomal protein S18 acetylase RimI-like enzyme